MSQAPKSMKDEPWLLVLQLWGRQISEEQLCFWWARVGVRPGHLLGLLSLQQTLPACIQHLLFALQRRSLGKDSHRKIMIQKQSWTPTSLTSHSHHSWRIPCLRTKIREQWGGFLFHSLYSPYGLFGGGEHLGSPWEYAEDSSRWSNSVTSTPGKLEKAFLRR